jgi:hypothetical protein
MGIEHPPRGGRQPASRAARRHLPGSLVALLLCTYRRWDRVTAKLIAAVEECGVLSGPDLDELAESLLSDEVVAVFPLAWISGSGWARHR